SPGSAPIAARSESAPASARCPTSAAVAQPSCRRKCTPSTIASTEIAQKGRAAITAASSPIPRTRRERCGAPATASPPAAPCPCVRASSAAMDSIRERSAVPVDDPRAVQVVGGELAAHAVAGKDADPEAPHLARHVPEHDVIVVQLHAEHRVGQSLDHLALEFDLVLLRHAASHLAARA